MTLILNIETMVQKASAFGISKQEPTWVIGLYWCRLAWGAICYLDRTGTFQFLWEQFGFHFRCRVQGGTASTVWLLQRKQSCLGSYSPWCSWLVSSCWSVEIWVRLSYNGTINWWSSWSHSKYTVSGSFELILDSWANIMLNASTLVWIILGHE